MSDILRQRTANLIPTVSGGAYQDAREVSIVWNTRRKHRSLPKFRCRMHQTRPSTLFSPVFSLAREKLGRRRRVRNDRDGTSRRKRRLFSSVLISSFPNRKLNLRFGFFPADLQQPLSQPDGCQHPYPFCPFGTFPPDRGNRPLEGEPLPPTTAVAEMVEVWYYDTITGEKETHYAADIRI